MRARVVQSFCVHGARQRSLVDWSLVFGLMVFGLMGDELLCGVIFWLRFLVRV